MMVRQFILLTEKCIKILDFLCVQDSGTIINPQVMKNQVIGGSICGSGFAIYEHLVFDPDTGAIKNANLLDYKLLRCADFPHKAEVLFVDYINEHLKPNGRSGIIVPEGVIFQTGTAYKQLRKRLIENDKIVEFISISDLVLAHLNEVEFENDALKGSVTGNVRRKSI